MQPRVQAPSSVSRGDVFQIRALINHPMETGLRVDEAGHLIPRKIINKFTCLYNDVEVFGLDLHEAMAANPYLAFSVRATQSGQLRFIWEEDGGAVFALETSLRVGA